MTAEFYSKPTAMSGGMFRVYTSSRPQNGSGILSSLARFLMPIGKFAMRAFTSKAGKKVAAKGAEALSGVAADALRGQEIGESIKKRSRDAALDFVTSTKRPREKLRQKRKTVKRSASASAFTKSAKKRRVKVSRGKLF